MTLCNQQQKEKSINTNSKLYYVSGTNVTLFTASTIIKRPHLLFARFSFKVNMFQVCKLFHFIMRFLLNDLPFITALIQ
jgi:hypothetical protein